MKLSSIHFFRQVTLLLLLLCGLVNWSGAQEKNQYIIIIHPEVNTNELSQKELSRIFLKKRQTWDDENKIIPVDQVSSKSVRDIFSEKIHRKKTSTIKAFWQKQIFSGRSVPPPEKKDDQSVLEYVQDTPGAIGYVSSAAAVSEFKVKLLDVKE